MRDDIRARSSMASAGFALALLAAGCAASGPVDGSGDTGAAGRPVAAVVAPGQAVAGLDDAQLLCVEVPVTGGRVPRRVCRTVAEWKASEQAGKAAAPDAQGAPRGTGVAGN